jgi:hypothetical protein
MTKDEIAICEKVISSINNMAFVNRPVTDAYGDVMAMQAFARMVAKHKADLDKPLIPVEPVNKIKKGK